MYFLYSQYADNEKRRRTDQTFSLEPRPPNLANRSQAPLAQLHFQALRLFRLGVILPQPSIQKKGTELQRLGRSGIGI